jgi:hypothetical protein
MLLQLSLPELTASSAASNPHSHCRKRSQRRRPFRTSAYPSSGLLSLLATIVSTSSAEARPITLDFLCPGVDTDCLKAGFQRRSQPKLKKRARVPDRYAPGTDGLWRKTGWTLYGSAMCEDCPSALSTSTPSVDDAVSSGSATSSAVPMSTTSLEFMNSLPPGWRPVPHKDDTATILSISLSLAFFICLVMVFCILWRKGLKHKHVQDVEKRRRKKKAKVAPGDDTEVMVEKKLAQTKTKALAKATARWKENARYTFRHRRLRRKAAHTSDSEEVTQIQPENTPLPSFRRSSFSSVHSGSLHSSREDPSSPSSPVPSIPPSPPAYLHPLPASSDSILPTTSSQRRSSTSSLSSLDTYNANHSIHYASSHHMAHVATDDKALLKQLSQLISAPDGSHDTPVFSAPVWRDQELADFARLDQQSMDDVVPSRSNNHAMIFPPPPTHFISTEKGKGVEHFPFEDPYDSSRSYSFGYDQSTFAVEPDVGPSAPPFEPAPEATSPSAPPLPADGLDSFSPTINYETRIDEARGQNSA